MLKPAAYIKFPRHVFFALSKADALYIFNMGSSMHKI
jgi:hypothetical protein